MASDRPTTATASPSATPGLKPCAASNGVWPESFSAISTSTNKTVKSLANRQRLDIGETHGQLRRPVWADQADVYRGPGDREAVSGTARGRAGSGRRPAGRGHCGQS